MYSAEGGAAPAGTGYVSSASKAWSGAWRAAAPPRTGSRVMVRSIEEGPMPVRGGAGEARGDVMAGALVCRHCWCAMWGYLIQQLALFDMA